VQQRATTERVLEPNIAAFVVGVVATAAGGVTFTAGAFNEHPTSTPVFYAGGLGLLLGVPLAIGPWIGRTRELVAGRDLAPVVRDGAFEACGERGISGRVATVSIDAIDVRGRVDADGVFQIPPYTFLDAYAPDKLRPMQVTAILEDGAASKTISAVLEVGKLASFGPAYLKSLDNHDARIEPFRMVPGIQPGTLRVSLTSTPEGPAVRVVLPLENKGPGDSWQMRGKIDSPVRALDGRMLYFGHIKEGEVVSREAIIPIAPDVASMLRGATIVVTVVLRDGHGTAPETPVKFNGTVLIDAPRS
jgi:hypothetical protein